MMKPKTQNLELISALADDQLSGEDVALAVSVCASDAKALERWETYHFIGEVLRAPASLKPARGTGFVVRLNARLAQETAQDTRSSVIVALPASWMSVSDLTAARGSEAANDSSLRWKFLAGFASITAAAAIGWNTGGGLSPNGSQLARQDATQQLLLVSDQGTMVRDARMQELLAAHKQFGGTSALQAPSGFLRNATFETSQDERR